MTRLKNSWSTFRSQRRISKTVFNIIHHLLYPAGIGRLILPRDVRGHRLVFADDGLILAKDIYSVNSRNITASLKINGNRNVVQRIDGAFGWRGNPMLTWAQNSPLADDLEGKKEVCYFDASSVVPTSTDNHPYSTYMVPLITY